MPRKWSKGRKESAAEPPAGRRNAGTPETPEGPAENSFRARFQPRFPKFGTDFPDFGTDFVRELAARVPGQADPQGW